MRPAFYDKPVYRKKQSEIAKQYYKLHPQNKITIKRICHNNYCKHPFEVKRPSDPKIYCGHSCAATIINTRRSSALSKEDLTQLYSSGLSINETAKKLNVSPHKVTYWMNKHRLAKRSISDAVYLKNHPNGDPFCFKSPTSIEQARLLGIGIGLYWGEGNKLNKTSIRLANTDPDLINTFIRFMEEIFGVDKDDLRFSLQIFTDIDELTVMNYWTEKLGIKKEQFYKTVITKSHSLGTYRKKSKYGVIMLYYHNRKLRDLLVGLLPTWLSGRARSW